MIDAFTLGLMYIQAKQIVLPPAFKKGIILFIVLLITFVSFFPSLHNDFITFDDQTHYLKNPDVLSINPANIAHIFSDSVNKTYIPLTILSFAVEHKFFGRNAFVFHRDNLLLHMGVVALIFFFALKLSLGVYGAGFAALLFGIHPMHVESVAWVTERKDVLYALFYMLALNSYLRYIDTFRRKAYWFSIIYGILSVLAKPMALSLPLILFLIDWIKKRTISRKLFLEKAPYFLSIVPIAAVTYFMNARTIHNELQKAFLIWNWSLTFYIQKFFVPFNFSPLYVLPKPTSLLNLQYGLSLFLTILFAACIIRLKRDRWFIFACLFYFLSIFFLLRYDEAKDVHIVADRFMYLPSLGFCLYLGVVLDRVRSWPFMTRPRRAALITVVGLGMALLAQMTFAQCKVWKDGVTLWEPVVKRTPKSRLAHYLLGKSYENKGEYAQAINYYSKAIKLEDDYGKAYVNRGSVYALIGQYGLALADFDTALAINPELPGVYMNRGSIYLLRGEYSLAAEAFHAALSHEPDNSEIYANRGIMYLLQGQYDLALSDFDQAIRINPNFARVYFLKGNLYFQKSQWEQALAQYNEAIKLDPELADAYYQRFETYRFLGRYPEALEDAQKAAELGSPEIQKYFQELNRSNDMEADEKD